MPLFMDLHKLSPDMTVSEMNEAHERDLAVQEKYDVNYLTYFLDEAAHRAYCLVEAPDVDAAIAVHRNAHAVADEIIAIEPSDIARFALGTPAAPAVDPSTGQLDRGIRCVLFTDIENSTALTQRLGDDVTIQILDLHDEIVRAALGDARGHEIKHTGDGIMAAFNSATNAIDCALAVQTQIATRSPAELAFPLGIRIGLSAGEPVTKQRDLYGAAVQLASRVCSAAEPGQVLVSSVIRELCIGKPYTFADAGARILKGFDEPLQLYEVRR